jgi:hypothetical protein
VETFVVRIWKPAGAESAGADTEALHGEVQHVSSASSGVFRGDDELVRFIRARLHPDGADSERGER